MSYSCWRVYALFKINAWEVKTFPQQYCLGGYDKLPVIVEPDLGIHVGNFAWKSTRGREGP